MSNTNSKAPIEIGVVSYDVFTHILSWLHDDYPSLYRCSLSSRSLRDASAAFLYRRVTYSPAYSPVLDLKKRDEFVGGFFASARLPHNSNFVRRLEVSGFLSLRPPSLNMISSQLKELMQCLPNIKTVIFTPTVAHESLLTEILPLLPHLSRLRHLTVNTLCTHEKQAPLLAQLRNLESLTIQSPSRAILQLLPEWLGALSPTLRRFHMTHSCGSVTPGVLRSFTGPLQDTTSFALGLSYSLTDNDVFAFWADLPHLERLEYRFYVQLPPSITPRLIHLRHLTVHYLEPETRTDAAHLYKWIRRVISHAPLESLRLVCEYELCGPEPTFDSLLESLSARHAKRLKVLDMRNCYVGNRALRRLCERCTSLEELAVTISYDTLDQFAVYGTELPCLHTLNFRVRKSKNKISDTPIFARTLIRQSSPVRRLTVNDTGFEGTYKLAQDGTVQLMIDQIPRERPVFPWERGVLPLR